MKAILVEQPGGVERLFLDSYTTPEPNGDEILVKVAAIGVNRADLLQREGLYPAPEGASPLLGLEVAGTVVGMGVNVTGWESGDRVCALLSGGGYGEYVAVDQGLVMGIPESLSFVEAAAIPEVFLTAFQALYWLGDLARHDQVLIHAGASGVGTAAIQLVREAGAVAHVTAGSDEKLEACRELGAVSAFNYKNGAFGEKVLKATANHGADIILDFVGAPYWHENVKSLAMDGRIVMLATLGGSEVEKFSLRDLFRKRGHLVTSTLRSRSLQYRTRLVADFCERIMPFFVENRVKPVIDKVFPWSQVGDAHQYMADNRNIGKILLRVEE